MKLLAQEMEPVFTTSIHPLPRPLALAPELPQLQLQPQLLHLVPELTQMAMTLHQPQPQLQHQLQHQRQAGLAKTTPALMALNGLTATDQCTTANGTARTPQTAMRTEMASRTVDTMQTRPVVDVAAELLAMTMMALVLVPVRERSVMRSYFLQSRLRHPSIMRQWHIKTQQRQTTLCSNRQTHTRQARLKFGDLALVRPSIIRK